jgi:hypothetical protein
VRGFCIWLREKRANIQADEEQQFKESVRQVPGLQERQIAELATNGDLLRSRGYEQEISK